MNAKQKMETMMKDFGPCRCNGVCEVEQSTDEELQDKPGGRHSVCELEAEKAGIPVPPHEEE